jgi:PAS domain S-box-containing protein
VAGIRVLDAAGAAVRAAVLARLVDERDPRDTVEIRRNSLDEGVAMRPFRGAGAHLRAGIKDAVAPFWLPGRRLRAEREAERIFEMSPALLGVAGFDGYLRRFNPAFGVFGYSREELLSRPWIEFAHPDDRERMLQAAASLERGADVAELQNRVICRDGSVRWVEWSTRVMAEEGLFYAAGRDVTESHRAAEEQAALRRVATLVAQETSPEEVFAAVAREVGELLGVDATHMGRYEGKGTVVSVAQWGTYAGVPIGARFPLEGDSISARVLRAGGPARMESYDAAHGLIADTIRQMGIRSSIGVPISVEGRTWGVMIATSKRAEPFPAETESRLQDFTELVATAIANADSRDQLTASRARVLAAGDEARRRVVRDLHDGAQQRLVQTVMTLKLAHQALPSDPDQALPLLGEALGTAERATEELRELARGILPSALTRGGLRTGVDAFVSRLDLPVELDVSSERLPPEIEASAYFIVAEALTNVVKHARATGATVRAATDDGVLTLEVRDDGGGGADPHGHGLMGVADRVDALGGQLRIESPDGGGTVLAARLPLSTRRPRESEAR